MHPFCIQDNLLQKKIRELQGFRVEDYEMNLELPIIADEDVSGDLNGWEFDIKLQDYTQAMKYGCQFSEYSKSMLEGIPFFEKSCGEGTSSELLTPLNSPNKHAMFKSRTLQHSRPSRYNLPKRGGKVSVVCEKHRNDPEYCCSNKKLDTQKMLLCDFCLGWYHAKCEKVSGTDTASLDNYKCTNCVDWLDRYEKLFK